MGRSPCCAKEGLNRGAWTKKEDMILSEHIRIHGDGGWRNLPKKAGLKRCGKSCRLRWLNYLRPDIKRGNICPDEEELIIRLHRLLGNRWSLIAGRLPGRTDNEIKNYWNTHLSKKLSLNESQHKPSQLSLNESQHEASQNLSSSSKSPVPVQTRVFKATALKITTAVRRSEPFNLCSVKETTKSSRRDLLVKDSITDDELEELIAFPSAANLVETEATNSACSMSNLGDQQCSHFDHFEGDADTLAESSLYLKELSSPDCYLFPSPSGCSTDFASEIFNEGRGTLPKEINGFEDMRYVQSNMQQVNSLTAAGGQETEEFSNSLEHADWIHELDYLDQNPSAQPLSLLLLESEDEWEERATWKHCLEDPVQIPSET